jgi:hypothetical protein
VRLSDDKWNKSSWRAVDPLRGLSDSQPTASRR